MIYIDIYRYRYRYISFVNMLFLLLGYALFFDIMVKEVLPGLEGKPICYVLLDYITSAVLTR